MRAVRSGRPAVGETVYIPGIGDCVVLDNADPATVQLRTSSGAVIRAGERVLNERISDDSED